MGFLFSTSGSAVALEQVRLPLCGRKEGSALSFDTDFLTGQS
jgi:hypothetical protein